MKLLLWCSPLVYTGLLHFSENNGKVCCVKYNSSSFVSLEEYCQTNGESTNIKLWFTHTQYFPGMIQQVRKFFLYVVGSLLHCLDKLIYSLRNKRYAREDLQFHYKTNKKKPPHHSTEKIPKNTIT